MCEVWRTKVNLLQRRTVHRIMGYSVVYAVWTAVLLRSMAVMGASIVQSFPTSDALGPPCTTDDGKKGVCVLNFQCSIDTNTIIDSTVIELRTRSCPQYLQICCLSSEFVKPTVVIEEPSPPSCGWSNSGGNQIRNKESEKSTLAELGEFPWMVALLKSTASELVWSQKDFIGGGSIIHPSVVITIAHKVEGLFENQVKCRAGEWNLEDDSELYASQERQIKKIIVHDDFFRATGYYEVALLILEKPFTFQDAPHIGVGCLDQSLPEPGTECYTMGWGKNLGGNYSSILKKIKVPLIDSDKCQHSLRNTRLGSRFRLHPSLICAGGEAGVDSCKGDGGSPLVCSIQDSKKGTRYAIYGMTALGVGCGKDGVPGLYTNVPFIYDWVVQTMDEEGLNKTSFVF